jgi:hypothetical protein
MAAVRTTLNRLPAATLIDLIVIAAQAQEGPSSIRPGFPRG